MKTKRFFTTLGLAFAMSAPILAGCGKSGGKTSSSAEDIKYIVSYAPSADYTVSGIKTEGYSVNETVSFGVAVTDAENKEVNSVRYGTTTLELGTDNKYSFSMPEENVQLSISLKNIVKYSMTYTGSAKVDEEITIILKLGNDPVTADYTVEGKTDADKAKVTVRDGNKVKFLSEGKVTLVAKVNNEVKAELEVTAEKAAMSTIKEALEAATAEMKTVANGSVSTSTWTIGGEIVSINEKVSTSDATKFNFAVIIDDGTELVSLSVYDTKEKMTHKVGDKVKAEVKFKSYYGLLQAYRPTTSGTGSFYSDQLLANDKTYTKKSATAMTAAQLDAYYAIVKDETKYNPIIPFIATGKNTKIGESMRFVYDGGNAENAGAIALVSTSSCKVDGTEGMVSTVKGYLYSGNTSSKYLTAHITEQAPLAPTSVAIDNKAAGVNLTINGTAQLSYTLAPVGSGASKVEWTSSNNSVATVSETGLVKGVSEGNATITIKIDNNLTDTINVTVSGALNHATGITLDKESDTLVKGSKVTLVPTVTAEDSAKPTTDTIAWASSNTNVATVEDGEVTAVAAGTANITATINGKTATCVVTVRNMLISDIKDLANGAALDVYGYYQGKYSGSQYGYWIGDGTASIFVNVTNNNLPQGYNEAGKVLHLVGTYDVYNGLMQIKNTTKTEVVDAPAGVTTPTELAITESNVSSLTAADQNRLATVTGKVTKINKDPVHGTNDVTYTITVAEGKTINAFLHKTNNSKDYYEDFAKRAILNASITVKGYLAVFDNSTEAKTNPNKVGASKYQLVAPSTTAEAQSVTGITLNKTSAEVEQGGELGLTATLAPAGITGTITWSCESASKKVTVNDTGKVSVAADATVGETAVVKAACSGFEATCTITVKAKEVIEGTIDKLTADSFAATGTAYADSTNVAATNGSAARYAANSSKATANGETYMQLRSSNSNSGIVSTTSGGKIRKVIVTFAEDLTIDRTIDVYCSNTAFTAPTQLYNVASGSGIKKVGSAAYVHANGTKRIAVDIEGDYAFVGVRSNSSSVKVLSVEFVWVA